MPAPNERLRVARERKRWSQQCAAETIGIDRKTYLRLETGQTYPQPGTLDRLCMTFDVPAEDLGFGGAQDSGGHLRDQSLSFEPATPSCANDMNRRQALQALLGVAGTALFLHDAPTTIRERANRPAIDAGVIPALTAMTQSYWQLRAHVATSDVRPAVTEHLNTLTRLLRLYSMTPSVREQLRALTGEVAQIMGAIAYDDSRPAEALAAYRTAIDAANEAGNGALHAVALGRLTLLYNHLHDHSGALATVQEAVLRAKTGANPTIRAWLALVEAETRAHLHDARGFYHATSRAETLAQRIAADDYSYWCGFDVVRLTSYRGTGLVQLQRPDEALPLLHQALALTAPHALRRRSTIGVELITAYVQRRDDDAAAALLPDVRSWAHQAQSRVNLQRLDHLKPRLIGTRQDL